ncbi:diaminopimelate epimerase, partial [Bacteroides xylanisolvens]|nr:diaminopimelate epimerase [Bacteroides xylanisolvens]
DRIVDTVLPAIHPSLKFTAVAVPNPHLIAFVSKEELVSPDLERIGKMLNAKNPYFPEGVNVTFAEILGK